MRREIVTKSVYRIIVLKSDRVYYEERVKPFENDLKFFFFCTIYYHVGHNIMSHLKSYHKRYY